MPLPNSGAQVSWAGWNRLLFYVPYWFGASYFVDQFVLVLPILRRLYHHSWAQHWHLSWHAACRGGCCSEATLLAEQWPQLLPSNTRESSSCWGTFPSGVGASKCISASSRCSVLESSSCSAVHTHNSLEASFPFNIPCLTFKTLPHSFSPTASCNTLNCLLFLMLQDSSGSQQSFPASQVYPSAYPLPFHFPPVHLFSLKLPLPHSLPGGWLPVSPPC